MKYCITIWILSDLSVLSTVCSLLCPQTGERHTPTPSDNTTLGPEARRLDRGEGFPWEEQMLAVAGTIPGIVDNAHGSQDQLAFHVDPCHTLQKDCHPSTMEME